MFTDQQLWTELSTDPLGLGYANETDVPAAALLIAPNYTQATTLSQGQLIVIMNTMQEAKAGAIAAGATIPAELSYIIDTLLPNVAKQESLDMTQPTAQAMLAAIQSSGLLTSAQITALTTSPACRAEILWGNGTVVSWQDVARVRNTLGGRS